MTVRFRKISAVCLAILMVVSTMGVQGAAAIGGPNSASLGTDAALSGSDQHIAELDDESIGITDSVSVWEYAPFSMRTGEYEGAVNVNVPSTTMSIDGMDVPVNKGVVSTYEPGDQINFEFRTRGGVVDTSSLAGEDAQLVVVKLNSDLSSEDAEQLLTEDTDSDFPQTVNDNAASVEVISDLTVDENGELSTSYTPDEAGHYAFFLAHPTSGDGFSETGGELSLSGEARIIGMEAVPVQLTRSNTYLVDENDEKIPEGENGDIYADPGETLRFNADSRFASEGVNPDSTEHMIVVYERSVFENSNIDIDVTKTADGESIEEITATSDITSANGVVSIDDDATMFDSVGDGELNPTLTLTSAGELASGDGTAGDGKEIDASMTAISGDQSEFIDVETKDGWSETKYVWIHVAVGDTADQFSVDQGTICMRPDEESCYDESENTPPTIDDIPNQTVTEGETTTVPVTASDDDGDDISLSVDGPEFVSLSNGELTIAPKTGDVRTYMVDVTADDGNGGTATTTFRLTVKKATPVGGGGGGGGGGGPPSDDDEDRGPDRIKAKQNGDRMTASTGTVFGGQTVGFDVDNGGSLKNFDITMKNTAKGFNVEYADLDAQPNNVKTPPTPAVRFFEVNAHGLSDDDIDNVKFNFRLDSSELPDGISPDDVRLLRFHNGEWQTLETTHRGGDNYRAKSPGFTVYAIGYEEPGQPAFALSNPSLADSTVTVGQTTDVSASVENTGDATGTYTVELTANGEVIQTQDVTVPAGESKDVSFSVAFDEAGEYDLGINGESLGLLTVQDEPVDEVDDGDDSDDGDDGDDTGGSLLSGPVILALVLIIIVIGASVVIAVKRDELEELLK
ncbi:PGF-pre-PGF domain-containing protein [Haloprofundus salilacus]|uniref:PGF-pre-PGF domain-containing protein n=1 Tax=Haloprofundus salilacus TaxID=2876190 RepID=UPI001CC9D488|nr:PGF-pre-PGF domain-containing protein [Haloprofundus salilacus]